MSGTTSTPPAAGDCCAASKASSSFRVEGAGRKELLVNENNAQNLEGQADYANQQRKITCSVAAEHYEEELLLNLGPVKRSLYRSNKLLPILYKSHNNHNICASTSSGTFENSSDPIVSYQQEKLTSTLFRLRSLIPSHNTRTFSHSEHQGLNGMLNSMRTFDTWKENNPQDAEAQNSTELSSTIPRNRSMAVLSALRRAQALLEDHS